MRIAVVIVEDSPSESEAISDLVTRLCDELGMTLGEPTQEPERYSILPLGNLEGARKTIEEHARLYKTAQGRGGRYPGVLVIFDVFLHVATNESLPIDYIKTLLKGLLGYSTFQPRVLIYSKKIPDEILKDRELRALVPERDVFWKWDLMEPERFTYLKAVIEQVAQ